MKTFDTILYETPAEHVARIVLTRPETRNAQDTQLLYESFGIGGVEFFAHPWELGPRKAKERLFTSNWLSAEEAKSLGMVNQIVPRDTLEVAALAMAKKIARSRPSR